MQPALMIHLELMARYIYLHEYIIVWEPAVSRYPFSPLQIEVSTVLSQAGATLSSLVSRTQDLVFKLKALQLDTQEFVCLKYLVLFNPGES